MKNTFIQTPVADVKFVALKRPVKLMNGKEAYTIRLTFDESQEGVSQFKETLAGINKNRVGVAKDADGNAIAGKFQATFNSKYAPLIENAKGEPILAEDLPNLGKGGKATASVVVSVSKGGTLPAGVNATLYLHKIVLHSYLPEEVANLKSSQA